MSVEITRAGSRRRMTKPARRSQLLAVAEQVFGELGYQAATLDEIARRSGVARSLLYEHFQSLDDMYLECVRAARAELDNRLLAAAAESGSQEDRLRAGIRAYFSFVNEHSTSWDVLFASGPSPSALVGRISAELRFRTAEQIAAMFIAEVPRLDPDEARTYAHAVSGAGEQLARWWRQHPAVPLETVVDRLMAAVWTGLRQVISELNSGS